MVGGPAARRAPATARGRPRPGPAGARSGRRRRPGGGRSSRRCSSLRPSPTETAHAACLQLLERYGVLTREAALAEGIEGGFAGVYPVLKALEERGAVRRGYFVAGLGAAQFALPGAVDRLRSFRDPPPDGAAADATVVLAATDPAQPYRRVVAVARARPGGRPARTAGAHVVLVDGELAATSSGAATAWSPSASRRLGTGAARAWSTAAGTGHSRSARSTASRSVTEACRRSPPSCGPPASSRAIEDSSTGAVESADSVRPCPRATRSIAPPTGCGRRWSARPLVRLTLHHASGGDGGPRPANAIEAVEAVGKHLLIRFERGTTLRTHMRMTGSWHLYRSGERWRKPPGSWRGRSSRSTGGLQCASPRRSSSSTDGTTAAAKLSHLGPDLTRADVSDEDIAAAAERMRTLLDPRDEIGNVLLDQRVACGVGNVYKSEALFACGVEPVHARRATSMSTPGAGSSPLRRGSCGSTRTSAGLGPRSPKASPSTAVLASRAAAAARRSRRARQGAQAAHDVLVSKLPAAPRYRIA